ncbi:MAG: hypothetical protein RJB66_2652 [Pseudomonadota bacterium]
MPIAFVPSEHERMDAVILNASMNRILTYSKDHLLPLGFSIAAEPPLEEDSGDLVSTESMAFILNHNLNPFNLRFFVCCGKGAIEDYISVRICDQRDPSVFVDAVAISAMTTCSQLHLVDFNSTKKPMADFLETFLSELTLLLPNLMIEAPLKIKEKKNQGDAPFQIY